MSATDLPTMTEEHTVNEPLRMDEAERLRGIIAIHHDTHIALDAEGDYQIRELYRGQADEDLWAAADLEETP